MRRDSEPWPPLGGDFVLGNADSPVAVCTLASRSLLPALAGRPEIAIAGRVFTENVGVERMVQNLVANPRLRVLILCGRESPHLTGRTILSLHRSGLDADRRVVGAAGQEPFLPNLSDEALGRFRGEIELVDMIGEMDPEKILERALERGKAAAAHAADGPPTEGVGGNEAIRGARANVERIQARADSAADWRYDPLGFFLIFVDREARRLRMEQYSQQRELLRLVDGESAREICDTVVRLSLVSELQHAAYLGRELAKAETALRHGLHYEQDSRLGPAPSPAG